MPDGPSGFYGDAPAADPSGGSTDSPSNDHDDDDDGGSDGVDGPPGFAGDAAAADVRGGATDYPGGDGYYNDAAAGSVDAGGGRVDVGAGVVDAVRDRVSGVGDSVRDVVSDVGGVVDDVGVGDAGRVVDDVGGAVDRRVDDVGGVVDDVTTGVDGVTDSIGTPDQVGGAGSAAPDPATYDPNASGPGVELPSVGTPEQGVGDGVTAPDPATYDPETSAPDIEANLRDRARQTADPEITDDLTTGGVLSEVPGGATGVVPGTVGGVDVSEQRLRDVSADIDDRLTGGFEDNAELTVAGSDAPDRFVTGAANVGADVLNPAGLALGAETATEIATSAPGEIADEGVGDVAAAGVGVGAAAGAGAVRAFEQSPVRSAGGAVFSLAPGAAVGRGAGVVGRSLRDRGRTVGGERIDARGLSGDDVVRYTETDGAEGERFPPARNPDTYGTDPATAVQEQADEFTPEAVANFFDDQGVSEGTTLKKALDVEPDGSGRGGGGFVSAPDEVGGDFDYETPGSFFGPELSPNFLRAGDGEASLSPVPGLPDTGNNPTGVLARTDVENADADTLEGFNEEMLDRAGETTARTKPPGVGNPGEIEAVVPPGAQFAPVRSGGVVSDVARRLGIGSEFYTEVSGRRVPLRPVAPEGRRGDGVDAGGGARTDIDGDGERLSYYVERPEQPVDRPVPGFGGGSSPPSSSPPSSGGFFGGLGSGGVGSGGFDSGGSGGPATGTGSGSTPGRGSGQGGSGSAGGRPADSGGSPVTSTPGALSVTDTSIPPSGLTPTTGTPTTSLTPSTSSTGSRGLFGSSTVTGSVTSTTSTTGTPTSSFPSTTSTTGSPTRGGRGGGTPTGGGGGTPGSAPGSPTERFELDNDDREEDEPPLTAEGDRFDSGISSAEEEFEGLGFPDGFEDFRL